VSQQGDAKALRIMMNYGCSVQVADVHGLTPLHYCCWAAEPAFDVAESILETDIRVLHMTNCRGASPLSYVREEHWTLWIEFFEKKMDIFWPQRDFIKADTEAELEPQPEVEPHPEVEAELEDAVSDREEEREKARTAFLFHWQSHSLK
jgi:hypothetical protein